MNDFTGHESGVQRLKPIRHQPRSSTRGVEHTLEPSVLHLPSGVFGFASVRFWPAIDAWLKLQGVGIVWDAAGVAFGQYAILRRAGSVPRRIVADFLIATHAEHHGLEVLSFDDTVFKAVFLSVTLLAC